jgi:tetratricopeptide (TPR) repeat protein
MHTPTEPKLRPARRKTQRRWRIPPVLTQGPEVFEGLGVLDEVPGEGGVVLWQALRDATLWAEAAPEVRPGLFQRRGARSTPSPALPPELAPPVRDLQALAASPGQGDPVRVAAACRAVAEWADERGLLSTALAFSQASAQADPMDAVAAYEVARLARRRAEEARAETWYRRTVAVARQRGDWGTYARAFLGLGSLHARRGSLAAARRFYLRALRAADRNTLRELEGRALHKLFLAAAEGGQRREAVRLAATALEHYGPHHPRTARLAFDAARHWVAGGHFARALPILRALRDAESAPLRLPVFAELARAAAGTHDADGFLDAWTQAWEAARDEPNAPPPVRAILSLSRAAAAMGAWGKAESAARHALSIAADARGRAAAEALLDAVTRRAAPTAPQPTEPPELAADADALAVQLERALSS